MSETVISVDNLGKKYSIRHQRDGGYRTLREALTDRAKNLFRRNSDSGSRAGGAGKSTLLKILSRITEPGESGTSDFSLGV